MEEIAYNGIVDKRFLHTEPHIVHTYTFSLSHQLLRKVNYTRYSYLLGAAALILQRN